MIDHTDDIDEVALNVLLAEGVDLPMALKASRHIAGNEDKAVNQGYLGAGAIVAAFSFAALPWFQAFLGTDRDVDLIALSLRTAFRLILE